ncbi:MAG TPA: hypothetical protein DCS93_37410 [Microscillaceae bacterium]|nr:hypothetical protein [Microscillaceae bacterium]
MKKITLIILGLVAGMLTTQAKTLTDTARTATEPRITPRIDLYNIPSEHRLAPQNPAKSLKALGGGWVAGKGHGYLRLGQRMIQANKFFNLGGEVIDITTAGVHITELYGEYGLGNNLEVSLYFPLFFRSTLNSIRFEQSGRVQPGDEVNSIGDINVGIKYALIKNKPFVLSASLILGIPSGVVGGGNTQLLQTGDGEFNQMLRLDVGYSFSPFYLTAGIGFNNRTQDFSDEIHANFEIGVTYKKLIAMIKAGTVQSLNNGEAAAAVTGIFSNNTEFISAGPEIAWLFNKNFGFSGGVAFAFAGQNILAAPAYNAGFFVKF